MAHAAVYRADERPAQVTGTVLPVDGGTTAGPPPIRPSDIFAAPPADNAETGTRT